MTIQSKLSLAFAIALLLSGEVWAQGRPFIRGDVNGDSGLDVSDPVGVLLHLFVNPQGAPCRKAVDVDDSGSLDVTDAVFGLQYLFQQGPPPPRPFPGCGIDPTEDGLSCDSTRCEGPASVVEVSVSCSADPGRLGWTLTNLLADSISVQWEVEGSAQQGTLLLDAGGGASLSTPRLPGVNVLEVSEGGTVIARMAQGGLFLSEIMTSNSDTLADADGDSSDWIEIGAADDGCPLTTDLAGWYLTDNPDWLTQWKFPRTTIASGGYLIVFASGKDRAVSGAELHTNFELDREGGYLALVAPDGLTVVDEFQPLYPFQLTDVSYGPVRKTTQFVRPGAQVLYHVPTSADSGVGTGWTDPAYAASGWKTGTSGLGFSSITTEGFTVTCIKSLITVDSIAKAQSVLTDPTKQGQVTTASAPLIDYFNSGSSGNYPNDRPFPGLGTADVEDFVVQARGTVLIPAAGPYSFGVNSDDGFHLDLTDGSQTFSMEYAAPRGPGDTIQVFNLPHSGPYNATLLFYERGGGSELELFAAPGSHPVFNFSDFRLVGDTANGGLSLLGFSSAIGTDVGADLRTVNASIWTRIAFQVSEASSFGGLLLRMRYEDGFIAYLNGQKVAARSAPASPQWNSAATSNRALEKAPLPEEISLTGALDLLVDGRNVLAIHGLNDSAANGDFLLLPELVGVAKEVELQYLPSPTPGKLNLPGGVDFVRDVQFSVDHGFFGAPFSLALSTPTPGATIRYTLNGATPTSTSGTVYSAPLTISRTTVLRAAAFKTNYLDAPAQTRTYLFLADVIRQSPTGQPPGPGWPSGSVNGQLLDYGMDPDIVNNARWSGDLVDALLSVPTISVVTDLPNLFSPSAGIYVNATREGRAWERRTSIELIHPDGTPGFAVDAGLRIRGAFSRSGGNPKHAFHVTFRSEYGTRRLAYPLFGGEGAETFDKIDLRCSQNYSWAFEGSNQDTIIREVFSRDVQRDLRQPYTRSRYYHLYLDGHYWGVYQSEERAQADYASSYLGGDSSDYDVVKNDSSGSRVIEAADGTLDSYRRLYDAAVAGFSTDAAYYRVQGLRTDGTADPAGEKLVDIANLADYMACVYYAGDPDSPVSCWAQICNNLFGVYNRTRKDGFVWIRHDAEHSLGANGGLEEARLILDPGCSSIGGDWGRFNPAWLHRRLLAHPEYAIRFADRANRHFFDDGALSADRNIERWLSRAEELELAIIAESARWGDSKVTPPRTKDDWQAQTDSMVNTYFPQRGDLVIAQMRTAGMFPDLALVSFSLPRGEVAPGAGLRLSQGNGTAGTIYYTVDGSDPRLRGGAIAPGAGIFQDATETVTLVADGSSWRYLDDGSDQGTAWRPAGFDDGGWKQGPAQFGYGDGDEATVVDYGLDPNNKHLTTYFRRAFTVTDAAAVTRLTLRLIRDDGAAVYLNGSLATPPINLPGTFDFQTPATAVVGGTDESTWYSYDVSPGLLVDGPNLLAVEVHQSGGASTDLSFDLALEATVALGGASPPIALVRTTTVKARVRSGSRWGALSQGRFTVGLRGLVINEVMAQNSSSLEDPQEPGEFPDWIEIYNGTGGAIPLGGMYLTDDLLKLTKWKIAAGVAIASGGHLVFLADDDGTQGPSHTNFRLSASGETLALVDTDGETILDQVLFDQQVRDVSYGRQPDGGAFGYRARATPGAANQP